jgi:hypothetical protein
MILVNSLPDDEFMFMKESLYAKDLSKSFPKFLDVLQDMQNFDLNKQKATLKLESPVPPGPTILSATTASSIPLRVECPLCHNMFNQTLRRDGKKHTNCYSCYCKTRDADASSSVHPTPAQVQDAQALSENYSLAATTSSIHPSSIVTTSPTTKLWHPDSASTFSITDDIKDLHRPKKLPTPIPITGANGAIIYATRVGSARFDHRLQLYFVPLSAVKLLSLGALSNLGYSYASGLGRCLTITTPFGRSLCRCPIQPNNTWIFPSSLISPKTSVRAGNSVLSSAAASRQALSRPSSAPSAVP